MPDAWCVIHSSVLVELLERAAGGEPVDSILIEWYANCLVEAPE